MKTDFNCNFISVDLQKAISSYGTVFEVGETVGHDGAEDFAIITSFEFDFVSNEIRAKTTKGSAHIDFLIKNPELK